MACLAAVFFPGNENVHSRKKENNMKKILVIAGIFLFIKAFAQTIDENIRKKEMTIIAFANTKWPKRYIKKH